MKNSVSHILSFILMCLLSFLITFVVVQISLTNNSILSILKKINYYDLAYENILNKIDEEVINHEVSDSYKEYFSDIIIKEDIKNILNEEKSLSHYDNLYEIISEYSNDDKIKEKYSSVINSIYEKNIFPVKEYNLINKMRLEGDKTLFISLILVILILFVASLIFIINKNFKYYKISIISTSILLILPLTLIKILNIFKNFMYTNIYYTNFILAVVNNVINLLFTVGIIILILFLVSYFIKRKNYLHLNKK